MTHALPPPQVPSEPQLIKPRQSLAAVELGPLAHVSPK